MLCRRRANRRCLEVAVGPLGSSALAAVQVVDEPRMGALIGSAFRIVERPSMLAASMNRAICDADDVGDPRPSPRPAACRRGRPAVVRRVAQGRVGAEAGELAAPARARLRRPCSRTGSILRHGRRARRRSAAGRAGTYARERPRPLHQPVRERRPDLERAADVRRAEAVAMLELDAELGEGAVESSGNCVAAPLRTTTSPPLIAPRARKVATVMVVGEGVFGAAERVAAVDPAGASCRRRRCALPSGRGRRRTPARAARRRR